MTRFSFVTNRPPLLEPVIDRQSLIAHMDQRTIHTKRTTFFSGARNLDLSEGLHLPSAARQAGLGRLD